MTGRRAGSHSILRYGSSKTSFLATSENRTTETAIAENALFSRLTESIWDGLARFLDDGRIEIDSNVVERAVRPIAMRESLCIPSSSVCKHWKRARVGNATRVTFPGH